MQPAMRRARLISYPLILMFLLVGFASQTAMAGIVGTDRVLSEQSAAADRMQLDALLEREDVQQKLVEYGVSPEEAAERVAALTNEEAMELAQRMDDLPAGGSAVVILLVVILLLLLLR
ncbi:MAG: PA2779 family protein [Ectothiorhodospiraceae bacterium]|nr:PA2779 family protein [Ectothiorhodospiraceae bacterium]MCH8506550.1 PA2779 family protein [Ectothiorhodospiraceae bacterium]